LEAKLFHADGLADGETDMTKLIVAFRNLANAPKKSFPSYKFSGFQGGYSTDFWPSGFCHPVA
jgi:hypothetical protein